MKLTSNVHRFGQVLTVLMLMVGLQPQVATLAQPALAAGSSSALTAPALSPSAAGGCQWSYYPISGGALQAEVQLYNDPDNTPIANLSTGNMFKGKALHLDSTGSTDFDGDNKTDVFRTKPRGDGTVQWQYSSGGTGTWQDMAYAGPEPLQFGDFDANNATDVFANSYYSGAYHWRYSPGGVASFLTLHTTSSYADRLALGDFNGDGLTDVFTATASGGAYQWGYYSGGSSSVTNVAFAGTDPALLRFGDIDGDGKTDVFAATRQPDGSTQWMYSSGGAASYTDLVTSTVPYSELLFGDFNGDGKTDVLTALAQSDGGLQVTYRSGGLGPAITLGHIAAPAPALRVGDFNGDGVSDLLALRCGMHGPLAVAPLQTLATSGYKTFYHALTGDVNGDGLSDVILISTCQPPISFGNCATHRLQIGAALGTKGFTNTLVAPLQLGVDILDFTYYRALAGDFDGDGKTDVALVYPNGSTLTIYVARSDGSGHFTLGAPQTFGGEAAWGAFNPLVGDFNGDGKDDLAFTTVCNTVALNAGSCTNGDNNAVHIATSGGVSGFTLSPRDDLGPSGWSSFYAFAGDFNGDGKTDLLFDSTCQKNSVIDSTCTAGDTNYSYTALSDGLGAFTLSALHNYGSGWSDYPVSASLAGDVNGDGRTDMVWTSGYQASGPTYLNLVTAGLSNASGTPQLGATQNFSNTWAGSLSLADLNRDGRADLVWNNASNGDSDVDTYAVALSNGDGSFKSLGPGAVYTSQGYFGMPENDDSRKLPTSLTLISARQNSISDALFIVNGFLSNNLYLPLIRR